MPITDRFGQAAAGVDDVSTTPRSDAERRGFLEICEARNQTHSMLSTSQLPVPSRHAQICDSTITGPILDRLAHNALRLELCGESMRRKRAGKTTTTEAGST